MTNVLELHGITKRFPGVLANDKVDITLREGKILALLGENGAGKTTLMNILYGLYKPDEGKILVRGQEAAEELCPRAGIFERIAAEDDAAPEIAPDPRPAPEAVEAQRADR